MSGVTILKTLNLTETEKNALDELIIHIKKDWPEARVKFFGSKVNGTFDEESDLDLLIVLPCIVTDEIRRKIVHRVFEINLKYGSNISVLIVSKQEWENTPLSLLPIHFFVEKEGISL